MWCPFTFSTKAVFWGNLMCWKWKSTSPSREMTISGRTEQIYDQNHSCMKIMKWNVPLIFQPRLFSGVIWCAETVGWTYGVSSLFRWHEEQKLKIESWRTWIFANNISHPIMYGMYFWYQVTCILSVRILIIISGNSLLLVFEILLEG